jgi:CheY-like chemotaxis protein
MSLLTGKRILIVEDDVINRIVYKIALAPQRAYLIFDRWGADTLRLHVNVPRIDLSDIDLIILDLMLADGVSGYEVFAKIRCTPAYNHIPIVAISASEPEFAIAKTQEMGFNGFISKPINEQLLPMQLEQVLNGGTVWFNGMMSNILR